MDDEHDDETESEVPDGAAVFPDIPLELNLHPLLLAVVHTVVFLAGQTALDAAGRVAGTGIVEQFERALSNLLTALRAAGGEPAQLASLTIYVTDMDDYKAHVARHASVDKLGLALQYASEAFLPRLERQFVQHQELQDVVTAARRALKGFIIDSIEVLAREAGQSAEVYGERHFPELFTARAVATFDV